MPFYTMPDQEKLFVRRVGEGEPVLVSGLGMQSWQWLPFLFASRKNTNLLFQIGVVLVVQKIVLYQILDAISSHWNDIDALIKQLKLDQFILMGYSMGATTAMHGMKHGDLGSKLKAYLHIDQTPKISVDETWQYGLFGQKHCNLKTYSLIFKLYYWNTKTL
jgi:pimeloyl-ACP methyl ester carboxylesterase